MPKIDISANKHLLPHIKSPTNCAITVDGCTSYRVDEPDAYTRLRQIYFSLLLNDELFLPDCVLPMYAYHVQAGSLR